MDEYCRLCAQAKSATALKHKLSDLMPKLVECCRWLDPPTDSEYPQNVCEPCAKWLDQCWTFNEAVKLAQKELGDIIGRQKAVLAAAVFVKAEDDEELVLEADLLNGTDLVIGELSPTKAEFFDFGVNPEDLSDFEWPDNHDDVWAAIDAHEDDDNDDNDDGDADGRGVDGRGVDGRAADKEEKANVSKSNENSGPDTAAEFKSVNIQKVTVSARRQEFLDQLSAVARLDSGRIHPNQITELKLCDWTVFKYRCAVCSSLLATSDCLQKHFSDSHPGTAVQWICSICPGVPDKYKAPWQLRMHVTNQHYPHLFFCCPKCGLFYWNSKKLQRHRQLHNHTSETLSCKLCDKKFPTPRNLHLHHQTRHAPKQRHFQCYLCKKKLASMPGCRVHMQRSHVDGSKAISVMCEQCGRVFKSHGALLAHLDTHNPEGTVICEICKRPFKSTKDLKKHMVCHGEAKQVSCSECDFRTRRVESLKNHMRIHRNERAYECDICFKKFTLSQGLRVHRRIHTGEKPFACTECEYRSVNGPNLNKHMKQRHGITFYKPQSTQSGSLPRTL